MSQTLTACVLTVLQKVYSYSSGIMGINTAVVKVALTEADVICFWCGGGHCRVNLLEYNKAWTNKHGKALYFSAEGQTFVFIHGTRSVFYFLSAEKTFFDIFLQTFSSCHQTNVFCCSACEIEVTSNWTDFWVISSQANRGFQTIKVTRGLFVKRKRTFGQ